MTDDGDSGGVGKEWVDVHLVPPMEEEPPGDYVSFVATHLAALRAEAVRLAGGDRHADALYPEVLCDAAARWRWLRWWRLHRPDAADAFVHRRLVARARRWRDEQVYPVDVQVCPVDVRTLPARPTARPAAGSVGDRVTYRPVDDSVAYRLAAVVPPTARAQARPVAEAAIAWEHAYRRWRWRRLGWRVGAVVAAYGGVVDLMMRASGA